MRVLVGCEESQAVTIEFRKLGHEAFSCDLVECSGGHPEWHLQTDIMDLLVRKLGEWDLIILHPPCTCVSVSGNSTYGVGKPKHCQRIESVRWTQKLWNLATFSCHRVAMENPVGVLNSLGEFPKPQYVQPYHFGHLEQKKTGLWLQNLKPLNETNNVYEEMMLLPKNQRERLHYLPPSVDRAKIRSATYSGVARAMAEQWG